MDKWPCRVSLCFGADETEVFLFFLAPLPSSDQITSGSGSEKAAGRARMTRSTDSSKRACIQGRKCMLERSERRIKGFSRVPYGSSSPKKCGIFTFAPACLACVIRGHSSGARVNLIKMLLKHDRAHIAESALTISIRVPRIAVPAERLTY